MLFRGEKYPKFSARLNTPPIPSPRRTQMMNRFRALAAMRQSPSDSQSGPPGISPHAGWQASYRSMVQCVGHRFRATVNRPGNGDNGFDCLIDRQSVSADH